MAELERKADKEPPQVTTIVPSYANVVKQTFTEITAREERGTNVVISGLPESLAESREERKVDERREVLQVLQLHPIKKRFGKSGRPTK